MASQVSSVVRTIRRQIKEAQDAKTIETIVNAYKTLSKVPSIVSARLNKSASVVTAKWSVRNLDKGKLTKYQNEYVLDNNLNVVSQSEFGVDVSNKLLSAVSPKETFKAVIREEKDAKDVKKQYLEVWSRTGLEHCVDLTALDIHGDVYSDYLQYLEVWSRIGLEHCVDLTALDIHGDVYSDSEFGSLDWACDESALVYVAEKKLKKSEPYIKRKGEEKKNDGSGEVVVQKGEEYVYKQDWGEQLNGKHLSSIVVCAVDTETFTVLDSLPASWCPGQVRFSADGESVVGVAWETEPRRLGLIFCTNRPSYIFELKIDGELKTLSAEGLAVRSPRVSPSGEVCWLQRAAGGPHHACHAIVTRRNNAVETVLDVVETEKKTADGGVFHGVFCQGLPRRCFSSDGRRLLFSTQQQTEIRSYVLDIASGSIVDISNKSKPQSTTILDVSDDVILAACSDMTSPGKLYAARLPAAGLEAGLQWRQVSAPPAPPPAVSGAAVQYLALAHDNEDSVKSFTALYMAPQAEENKKLPLIVWPHGGPHSGFVNGYSLEAALFTMLGFASLQVNYRGSTGSGEASLRFLPKRVGDADVKDCKLATDAAIQRLPIDDRQLCLFGGSHGGFLVTHLSGQYPELFKVVVSRNPVIDVASMYNSSDIPDWCAVEAGFAFSEAGPVSEDELLAMRRCSPLAHVHNVKAPTALMLGSGDKRVPHYQGLEYARRLKANGVKTKIYMYEDNHSLSSLPVEMDNLINSAHWFLEHLQS